MAIFTPRGLKIRLPLDIVFGLIARLYPNVDAFRVLKTTEGFESIPDFLSFVTGIICFISGVAPLQIGLYVFISSITGFFVSFMGFAYKIPILPTLGTLFSYIFGFVTNLIIIVWGFAVVGWESVVAWFVGVILAEIVSWIIDLININRSFKKFGVCITKSEIDFLNAYRWHAVRLNKSLDLTLSDDELKEENWSQCFKDLALKWPEVVSRFTFDE